MGKRGARKSKRGGTLYGTKHQRGRKKKNNGKKQRGGFGLPMLDLFNMGEKKARAVGDALKPIFDSGFKAYIRRKRQAGESISSKQSAYLRRLKKYKGK